MAGRLYAVGDVHGCLAELRVLLAALPLEEDDQLVFLGDYVDRGPDSAGVIELLCELAARRPGSVFLRGNHEDMMLGYLGMGGHHGEVFLANGGRATAASYGVVEPVTPDALLRALPRHHVAFLTGLALMHRVPGFVCVHAGVRPGVPLAQQAPEDLLWIRNDFLHPPHGLAETVVFGHTPHRGIVTQFDGKLGIDTACVYGGALTAVALPDRLAYQVPRGSGVAERTVLPPT